MIGGVRLPSGHRVRPDPSFLGKKTKELEPVLWITDQEVPGIDRLWAQVAERFDETGLWPVILESVDPVTEEPTRRPWDSGELAPSLSSDPDEFNAESVLRRWWKEAVGPDEDSLDSVEPFGAEFPGLARGTTGPSNGAAPVLVARELPGRLGLVPVARPADVPAAVGWAGPTNYYSDMGQLAAVLRSWEDRFGAVVVGLGFDTLILGVRRPPVGAAMSNAVAAEQFAVCPDIVWQGVESIAALAEEIDGQRTWFCWWD
ncbi:MAG TPA: DUF4253 domain-containing protein [Actinomycetota bacterium]|nr:DUF4253 domain-containing protein [Actinomycetota bacterium]